MLITSTYTVAIYHIPYIYTYHIPYTRLQPYISCAKCKNMSEIYNSCRFGIHLIQTYTYTYICLIPVSFISHLLSINLVNYASCENNCVIKEQ